MEASEGKSSPLQMASNRMAFRRKMRHASDKAASVAIAIGGVSVIFAILLIFMYLFYEVIPLFESATLECLEIFIQKITSKVTSDRLHVLPVLYFFY